MWHRPAYYRLVTSNDKCKYDNGVTTVRNVLKEEMLNQSWLLRKNLSPPNGRMNLVIWPRSPRVPHSSVVRASNCHLEGHGFDSRWEDSDFFWVITTYSTFLLLTHFSQSSRHYHIYIYHLTLGACSKQAYVTYEPSYMASLTMSPP